MKSFLWSVGCLFFLLWPLQAEIRAETTFLRNGVTAHRGSSVEFPENTLASIQAGIRDQADWGEVDIHLTSDGEVVLCHDAATKAVADLNLEIAKSPLHELRSLDVAYLFRKSKGLDLAKCPVAAMPTLKEALNEILHQSRTRLSLQPKSDCVNAAMAIIRELNAEAHVGFNDGMLSNMVRAKELAPNVPVFWDRPASFDLARDLALAKHLKFEALVFHHSAIMPALIQEVKAQGGSRLEHGQSMI